MDIIGTLIRILGTAWSLFAVVYVALRGRQAIAMLRRWRSGPEPLSVQIARDLWGWDIAPGSLDRAKRNKPG